MDIVMPTLYFKVDEQKTLKKIDEKKHPLLLTLIVEKLDEINDMINDCNSGKRTKMPEIALTEGSDYRLVEELGFSFIFLTIMAGSNKLLVKIWCDSLNMKLYSI